MRMGAKVPKQFLLVQGLPLLMHTLNNIHKVLPKADLVLTLPQSSLSYWKELCQDHNFNLNHTLVPGGETRFHSVQNGLNALPNNIDWVGIHDGVRPFVSQRMILDLFQAAREDGGAIPVLPVNFSLRKKSEQGSRALDREGVLEVQTPQVFNKSLLIQAFQKGFQPHFTDEASVWEADGREVRLVQGEHFNRKITVGEDLDWARYFVDKDLI